MEQFDFTTLINRGNAGAVKWQRRTQQEKDAHIIALSIADMELPVAPCIREAIIRAADGVYGYTNPDEPYFAAVRGWMERRHHWSGIQNDWIVCTNGVVPALNLAIRAFTKPGEGVMIQPPVYGPFAKSILTNERLLVENSLVFDDTGYHMDFDDFESKAADPNTKLFLLCSPHNPVARIWKRNELERIAEICLKHHVLLVSDEIHGDFDYDGKHITMATVSPDIANNCIICTSTGKTFNLAGLQLSNTIIPNPVLREQFRNQISITGCSNIPYFGYAATIAAYNDGEPWFDALLKHLRDNTDYLEEFLTAHFPQVRLFPLEGTYLAWMDWRSLGLSPEELAIFMRKKAGLILGEGTMFGKQGAGFERINLAAPRAIICDALERLRVAAKSEGLI